MSGKARRQTSPLPPAVPQPYLGHGRVDLQNLLVAFDLAHADFAGELGGGRAESLQGEGTVQGLLVAAPHLREGELLRRQKEKGRGIGRRNEYEHANELARAFTPFITSDTLPNGLMQRGRKLLILLFHLLQKEDDRWPNMQLVASCNK